MLLAGAALIRHLSSQVYVQIGIKAAGALLTYVRYPEASRRTGNLAKATARVFPDPPPPYSAPGVADAGSSIVVPSPSTDPPIRPPSPTWQAAGADGDRRAPCGFNY